MYARDVRSKLRLESFKITFAANFAGEEVHTTIKGHM